MSDPQTHEIRTVEDMLAVVTVENINTLIADFAEFLRIGLLYNGNEGSLAKLAPVFRWTDDDDPGLAGVNITFGRRSEPPHSSPKTPA